MKYIRSVCSWFFPITLTAIPLVFLPVTQDYYHTIKWTILSAIALCIFFFWIIQTVRTKKATIALSPASLGLGAIALASTASLLVASHNKIEALLAPFGPVTWMTLLLFSFLLPQWMDEKMRTRLRWLLYASTSLLGLIAVYQFFGMGKVMFPSLTYLSDPLWTPTGSTVATITILVMILPLLVSGAIEALKAKRETQLAFVSIMTITVVAGCGILLWQLVPKIASVFLPLPTGWTITLEILKNPKQALVGVGAENFLAAFSAARPLSFNLTPLWNTRFTTNSTLFFHLVTIYGLLGGAAFAFFAKSLIRKTKHAISLSLLLACIAAFVLPPNLSVLVVITILLLLSGNHESLRSVRLPQKNKFIQWITVGSISICSAAFVIGSSYCIIRAYQAEAMFYQSIQAAQRNNGTLTYNLQIQAIQLNPKISRFHTRFSQTNIALASSLSNAMNEPQKAGDPSKDTTKDRELIAQLIQQSIREAKIAVSLNPEGVIAWENLARIYGQLINVAQGADTWAITSYKQAQQLDPTNPSTRVELGGVYVSLANLTQAITQFQQATALKPDFPNAWYNLASAYRKSGDTAHAIEALQQVIKLVNNNPAQLKIASDELAALRKDGSSVSTPSAAPAGNNSLVVPPLVLPSTAGPGGSP